MDKFSRRLMWHGALLFLLGLVTGQAVPFFTSPRLGLAAHLEGVLNGMLLIAVGAIWASVWLSDRAKSFAYWATLIGAYSNWLVTSLNAAYGTSSPVLNTTMRGTPLQETLIFWGFMFVGIAIAVAMAMILWGLRGKARQAGS